LELAKRLAQPPFEAVVAELDLKVEASCRAAWGNQEGRPLVVDTLGESPAEGNLGAWAFRAASDTLEDSPSAVDLDNPSAADSLEGSLAEGILVALACLAASDIREDNPSAESWLPQEEWRNRWANLV